MLGSTINFPSVLESLKFCFIGLKWKKVSFKEFNDGERRTERWEREWISEKFSILYFKHAKEYIHSKFYL